MNWLHKNKEVLSINDMPSEAIGFIYAIHYTNGQTYIGKKIAKTKKKKHFGKKKLATITDKRLKTYEYIDIESNWKSYSGSSKLGNDLEIKNKEIIVYCPSKKNMAYMEYLYLFKYNVLGSDRFLNENIGGKFWKGDIEWIQ